MPTFGTKNPPIWKQDAIASTRGWIDPQTGEVLVAVGNLISKQGAAALSSITYSPASRLFRAGQIVTFFASFDQAVAVTGTPQLNVDFNSQARTINYTSPTATGSITKVGSTVGSIAVTNAGYGYNPLFPPAVTISGGSGSGATAVATVSYVGSGPAGFRTGVITGITVTNPGTGYSGSPTVTIAPPGGSGATATITKSGSTVGSIAVTAGGTGYTVPPQVTITGGSGTGATAYAVVTNGSVTSVVVTAAGSGYSGSPTVVFTPVIGMMGFTYTIASGDDCTPGQFSVTSLALNSGTITNGGGVGQGDNAVLTLPTRLDHLAELAVDTVAPTVSSAAFSVINPSAPDVPVTSGDIQTGDILKLALTMSSPVVVNTSAGVPFITVSLDSGTVDLVFTPVGNQATPTVLNFEYTVKSTDHCAVGDLTTGTSVTLNSGTIEDIAGNAATLTFSAPTTSTFGVNSSAILTLNLATGAHGEQFLTGDVMTFTATFDNAVTVTGTPEIAITGLSSKYATYSSGSGTSQLVFTYTVVSGDNAAASAVSIGSSALTLNSGSITDTLTSNAASLTLPTCTVGNTNLAISGVSINPAPTMTAIAVSGEGSGVHFTTGNTLTITTTWSELVDVTGTPEIGVTIGTNTRQATYASGTGTNTLVFTYTIVSGDSATAGGFVLPANVSLNSGTIKLHPASTNAALALAALSTATIFVN